MRKFRPGQWDEPFEFDGNAPSLEYALLMDENEETIPEMLEEAHEALSRLYNKSTRRAKQVKIPKNGVIWH